MPSLFTLPRQVPLSSAAALLAGCKLTFSATGSSTLQNTYSDINLTVANANPVVADASGVFSKIYLDPTLPNYRVKLTTSANVLIYQEDDIPSNQNTTQSFRLKATAPALTFEETDASSDNKIWRLKVNGEQLLLTILNDAEAVETTVFTFDRTGTTVDTLNFAGQYLTVQGNLTATQISSSIASANLTGCTATVTGTLTVRRTGTKVAYYFPSTISGTSNTNAMSITNIGSPAFSNGGTILTRVIDNGVVVLGTVSIGASGITFGVGAASGAFTAAGTKGIPGGTLIVYDTDLAGVA